MPPKTPRRILKAREEVTAARDAWGALKDDPEATTEQRMAAKDRYNRAMRDLALASGTRAPYG